MKKKCVVIIPALNEEKTIGTVIDRIPKTMFADEVYSEVVVIDDGSTDSTRAIALEHGARVLSNKTPQGVGSAFGKGVREAIRLKADYAVNIDGDGQMIPEDIPKLLEPIMNGAADMVTASRFMKKEFVPTMPKIKLWGNKKVAQIVSFIIGMRYYDVACGFRAYSKETLCWLNLTGKFTYTQETFLNLAKHPQIRIEEIPIEIRGEREHGKSRVASNVFKYAWKSGKIIINAFKEYKPIKFFGSIAAVLIILACLLEIIFFSHFFATGYFKGYLWAGLSGAFLLLVALLCLIIMVISDTMAHIIYNQEEQLYFARMNSYYNDNEEEWTA